MIGILKLMAWITITIMAGWSVLSFLPRKKNILFFAEKMALSYCLGAGLISIEMALLSVFKTKFSVRSIVVWWVPVFVIAFMRYLKNMKSPSQQKSSRERDKLQSLEKFLVFGISFEVLYAFFRALVKPIESFDAIAIYALKAKIFYLQHAIPQNFFSELKNFVPHVEYPLLLPLSETCIYVFLGNLNDLLVKVISPLYYLAILLVFYFLLRRNFGRKISLLFTFLLASIPQFKDYATNGYADILLAFYYSASFFYLFLWIQKNEKAFLMISFLCSALGMWTKSEGLILIGINMILVIIYIMSKKGRKSLGQAIPYLAVSLALIGTFLYIKKIFGVAINSDFDNSWASCLPTVVGNMKRIPLILYEYQRQFFGPKKWNIVWILLLLGLIANFKKAFLKDMKFVTLSILLIFLFYALIFMATPQNITWHLSTTVSRLFIHFLPIVVLWLCLLFKELKLEI